MNNGNRAIDHFATWEYIEKIFVVTEESSVRLLSIHLHHLRPIIFLISNFYIFLKLVHNSLCIPSDVAKCSIAQLPLFNIIEIPRPYKLNLNDSQLDKQLYTVFLLIGNKCVDYGLHINSHQNISHNHFQLSVTDSSYKKKIRSILVIKSFFSLKNVEFR